MLKVMTSGCLKTQTPMIMMLLTQRLTNNTMPAKLYTSEVYMRKRYLMDKKTPEEIAKECGCTVETVYVYLAKFGLRKSKR